MQGCQVNYVVLLLLFFPIKYILLSFHIYLEEKVIKK